jgi:hypothetical protein
VSQEQELRRLAWDFAEWAEDPPLQLDADDQRKVARWLNDAANTIDELRDGRKAAFIEAVEECQAYAEGISAVGLAGEHLEVPMQQREIAAKHLAMRIAQRAKRAP